MSLTPQPPPPPEASQPPASLPASQHAVRGTDGPGNPAHTSSLEPEDLSKHHGKEAPPPGGVGSVLCAARMLGSGLQPPGNFSWALRPQGQTITTLPQAATQQGYHLVPQDACLHPSTVAPVHYQHLIAFGFSIALSHLLLQSKKPGSSLGA